MSSATHHTRFPLLERAPSAVLLALVSGLLNAWTFGQVGSFATVQSGNLVSLGYFLADENYARALIAGASVLSFAAGALLCSLYVLWRTRRSRSYAAEVLVFEVLILVLLGAVSWDPGANPWLIALVISFLAGVQGNAFHRETGMLYGNVAVTFVVQMAASLTGRAIGRRIATDGQPHLRPAGAYLLVLIAFAGGGGLGFALDRWWASSSILMAAVILAGLWISAISTRGPVDPSQNAPTP
jgi:uncharacterized membrane protein YoaK (UPF0700 family)